MMIKLLVGILILALVLFCIVCTFLYFYQERLIFFPEKLGKDFRFDFGQPYEELNVTTRDNIRLNGVLFRSDQSRGLIFYLHGNAGSVDSWGGVAKTYTDLQYDVLLFDYRGFGKSEGKITGQEQLFQDAQAVYDGIKSRYRENDIIILGYSIGTGMASQLASANAPKLLILQAPYYSLTDLTKRLYPFVPTMLLKYTLENYTFIQRCAMPVVIFHGDRDEVIYYQSSVKLQQILKPADRLVTLHGQSHNGMTDNPQYRAVIRQLLSR